MPFIPTLNTAKVAVRALIDSQQCENIWYVTYPSALTDSDLSDIADTFHDWAISGVYVDTLPTDVLLQQITVRDVSSDLGVEVTSSLVGFAGTDSSTPLPNNVTFAVHKNAVVTGRHNKARVYHLAIPSSGKATANTLSGSYITALIDAYDSLRENVELLAGGDARLTYVEFVDNGVPLSAGETIVITGFSAKDNVLDSQRRRLPGRGR